MNKPIHNLDNLPKSAEDHMWSDYIELLCLLNVDRVISKADILDRVRERKDLGGELDELSEDIIGFSRDNDDISIAEIDDKWSLSVDDWFKQLEYRSNTFDSFYPFMISKGESILQRKAIINSQHKLYVFLLVVSNIRRIKRNTSFLTNSFEIVSSVALKSCLPEDAHVHVFSRNPLGDKRYDGNIWNKLKKLEVDLGAKLISTEESFSTKNTADEGLDIVGWVSIGDSANGRILVFGQCACTTDWPQKQLSSSSTKWREIIHMKSPPINMVFIPFCFRQANGAWWRDHQIQQSILIDRPRFIHLLKNSFSSFDTLPYQEFIDEVLAQQESLF